MPILPGYEPRTATIPAKVDYELSIEYQLEKVLFCINALSSCFVKESDPIASHPNDFENHTYFHMDSLITNVATLAEYYFSNVIYSVFGTILETPEATHFSGFVNGEYEQQKEKAFKRYKLGQRVKANPEEKKEYLSQCSEKFDETIRFLFEGKYDVLFNISNYIKHNCRIRGVCLKIKYDFKTYHYIRFTSDNAFMLKPCFLKSLILSAYKNDVDHQDGFCFYVGEKLKIREKIGNVQFLIRDGVIYVKGDNMAGITSKSIIILSLELSLKIIDVIANHDKGALTRLRKLSLLRRSINDRLLEMK